MNLSDKTISIWNKAKDCNCGSEPQDSAADHKLCGLCNGIMHFGAHVSVENQKNSSGRWNIDHKKPKSKGGTNRNNNLQAVHFICNRNKDDYE